MGAPIKYGNPTPMTASRRL